MCSIRMVFGKHTPFPVLVWQMRSQVRHILFTLVYDIRANRLLTTSRLFRLLYGQYAVYPIMVNMIGLHHDGQYAYDWFTPWRALYKVGYLQHQELLSMCSSMSELWTLKQGHTSLKSNSTRKQLTGSNYPCTQATVCMGTRTWSNLQCSESSES